MKDWEIRFDEQFTARDSFRMMQTLDNVKSFIRELLADSKSQHADELEEALGFGYNETIIDLIKKWRGDV